MVFLFVSVKHFEVNYEIISINITKERMKQSSECFLQWGF